jgi:uncharacterized membrane protein YkoI
MTIDRRQFAASVLALTGLFAGPVSAEDLSQSEALELRRQGTILPFEQIMAAVYERRPGARVVEAELSNENGRYIYEIEIFTADDQLRELELDARTADVLEDEAED